MVDIGIECITQDLLYYCVVDDVSFMHCEGAYTSSKQIHGYVHFHVLYSTLSYWPIHVIPYHIICDITSFTMN